MYGLIQIFHNYKQTNKQKSCSLNSLINIKLYVMLLNEALNNIKPHTLENSGTVFVFALNIQFSDV